MIGVAAAAVVAGSGAGLVRAPPSGPGQVETGRPGGVGDQLREQAPDFVHGQRDQPGFAARMSLMFVGGDDGQDGVGEHDQGGISVPGVPPSDLVLVEADSALRVLDRKSTRLNSSHSQISYAVFCLKKKKMISDGEHSD